MNHAALFAWVVIPIAVTAEPAAPQATAAPPSVYPAAILPFQERGASVKGDGE